MSENVLLFISKNNCFIDIKEIFQVSNVSKDFHLYFKNAIYNHKLYSKIKKIPINQGIWSPYCDKVKNTSLTYSINFWSQYFQNPTKFELSVMLSYFILYMNMSSTRIVNGSIIYYIKTHENGLIKELPTSSGWISGDSEDNLMIRVTKNYILGVSYKLENIDTKYDRVVVEEILTNKLIFI